MVLVAASHGTMIQGGMMGYLPEYYDGKIGKAKRAIVVATVLLVLILGLLVAAFLVNKFMFDTEYNDQLQPYSIYPRKFTVWSSNSEITISLQRTVPSDICLLRKVDYDISDTTQGKIDISIASIRNSTTFEFKGKLASGEYIVFSASVPVTDTVHVKITVDLLSPILIYVLITAALLIGLLLLRIGLKVRRIKILRYEKETEAVRPGSKPAPGGGGGSGWASQPASGWGGSQQPTHGGGGGVPQQAQAQYQSQQPIYQQSSYQRTPIYSKDDLQFFANVGEGSDSTSGHSGSEDGAVYALTPSDGPMYGEPLKFESLDDLQNSKKTPEPRPRGPRQQPKRPIEDDDGWGYVDEDEIAKKPHHAEDAKPHKKGVSPMPAQKDAGEIKYTLKGDKENVLKTAPEPPKHTPKYSVKKDKGTSAKGQQTRTREPRPPATEDDDGADGYLSPDDL